MLPEPLMDLPIAPVLGDVVSAVAQDGACVLQAPPGAGKTTAVPIALLDSVTDGKILILEPRRVAARAAAERLAQLLGEVPGETVGYRMRGESVSGRRIEVITEGILTRMIQSGPDLPGIGCIIFDEFHERALQADLGLALSLEICEALRPDLRLVVMSATLDAGPVAKLIGAPVITSEGRAFAVETRWRDVPLGPRTLQGRDYERAVADTVQIALAGTEGGVLVFLPGQGEIERVQRLLRGDIPGDVRIMPLYGNLPFKAQRAVLSPLTRGRKLVLSTSIAETSLTLPDIRVVVDGGRARRMRLDPSSGMSRLVTERVSRAEADQRRGRAGRVAEGICYRLWTRGEEGALPAHAPAEVEIADLVPLALDLAVWGAATPDALPFVTQPDPGRFAAARDMLAMLGALDERGRLTDFGRRLAALPVHPRLGRMLLAAGGQLSADLAALLELRDPTMGAGTDLAVRLEALRDPGRTEWERGITVNHAVVAEAKALSRRLAGMAKANDAGLSPGGRLSLAYPDRIALRRQGDQPRYVLSGGSGAYLDAGDPLAGYRMLVAADLDGDRREARIRRALPVQESEIRALHHDMIHEERICRWSRRHRRVEAREQVTLGALMLEDRNWSGAGDDEYGPALLEGVRDLGLGVLNWSKAAKALRNRIIWLNARGAGLPEMTDDALMRDLEDWLLPWLAGVRSMDGIAALDLFPLIEARLGPDGMRVADRLAPTAFRAPTGTKVLIDYSGAAPSASIRLQELFGLTEHPLLGPDRIPLVIEMLSPAGRPVQTTADLPGFWSTSYMDVRKDMRGRYPKHPWPENPADAEPTRRTKAAARRTGA